MPLPAALVAIPTALTASFSGKAIIAWFVANVACKLIYRAMFALGFGVIAYAGVGSLFDVFINLITDQFGSLPLDIKGLFDRVGVDIALGIMVSAGVYTATLKFATTFGFRGRPKGVSRVW